MTKSKNTKRALLASMISIVLCVAMLVGSTFAWFTDSATSGNNQILAGNLNVELYHTNAFTATEEKVVEGTPLFAGQNGEAIKWEPGVMVYENFTVKNEGTLALKYQLSMNIAGFNTVKDTEKSLNDVLKVAVIEGTFDGEGGRDAAKTQAFTPIADFTREEAIPAGEAGKPYAVIVYWEPSANDNDYNLNNGIMSSDNEPLYIDLGITLVATQATVESDSFGPDYDEKALYPLSVWNGKVDTEWYSEEANAFSITTPEALAGLSKLVAEGNTFAGKTISLDSDIDLGGLEWTPIGTRVGASSAPFAGTFIGNGHSVMNMAIHPEPTAFSGFFGYVENAVIEKLTVDGIIEVQSGTVPENAFGGGKGSVGVGGICGFAQGDTTISRCTNKVDITVAGVTIDHSDYCGLTVAGILGGCGEGGQIKTEEGNVENYVPLYRISDCLNEGNIKIEGENCDIIPCGIAAVLSTWEPYENKSNGMWLHVSCDRVVNVGTLSSEYDELKTFGCPGIAAYSYRVDDVDNITPAWYSSTTYPTMALLDYYFEGTYIKQNTPQPIPYQSTSAEDMAKQETFVGFDFENVWELTNGQYPTLRK